MIALMDKKDVTEKKEASEKYVFEAMRNIAIHVNKPKENKIDKKEHKEINKKINYFKW